MLMKGESLLWLSGQKDLNVIMLNRSLFYTFRQNSSNCLFLLTWKINEKTSGMKH